MLITKIGSSYNSSQFPIKFSNQVYFSEDAGLEEYTYRSPYSLKYVLSGYENYSVQGREVKIKAKQHLLVNNQSNITTLNTVGKAISIFIDPITLMDVGALIKSNSIEERLDNYNYIKDDPILFQEKTYQYENLRTQNILEKLANHLSKCLLIGENEIDPSLFFKLSEALIYDQYEHSKRLTKFDSIKRSTIQEQYYRLLIGYQYINDNWNQSFSLKDTASIAMLSPYHFHRLFKSCFSITPYQHHLKNQMDKAIVLLNKNKNTISEISSILGFNCTTSFGRTFKKYFGSPPSHFL